MGLARIGRRGEGRFTPGMKHGQWVSVSRPGSKKVTRSTYRGWDIEIIDRLLGMTIKRSTFSAVATSEFPPFRIYRGSLRDKKSALKLIHRLVDDWHHENAHLMSEEHTRSLRRRKMAKKLFKIRHKTSRKRR